MDNDGYFGDGDNFAKIISNNIYNQVSAIVEFVANFYDEDATKVRIDFTIEEDDCGNVYIIEIAITGDGNGFSFDELNGLREIGNSRKSESRYTKKFKRAKLGSFGIALTAFQNLGNVLEIYSKNNDSQILYKRIQTSDNMAIFSEIKKLDYCDIIGFETGCKFVIKNCKILKSIFFNTDENAQYYDLLRNKLSYLPIGNDFKIQLCDDEINRFVVADNSFKLIFEFIINDIKYNGEVCYSATKVDNIHYRGVFLQIDGRIIDWNIYNDIRQGISSPGSVDYRICGYITANGIRDKINAGRNGVTESYLSASISNMLKKNIGTIRKKAIKYYQSEDMNKKIINNKKLKKQKELQEQKQLEELKEYKRLKQLEEAKAINECNKLKELNANGNIIKKFETEDNIENNEKFDSIFENLNNKTNRADIEFKEPYNNESERKEWVNKRIKTPNVDLKRLGVEFCYDPEFEMEVIIIASQMCQMKLLDFDILQATPSGTDCIILKNSEKAFLEFEESLCNFFMHNHNHNGIDYILCWDVNEKDLKRQSEAYVKRYSGYIESIRYNESKGECTFINCDGTNHNIKLYILSEMIKEL